MSKFYSSLSLNELSNYVCRQLNSLFPDGNSVHSLDIIDFVEKSLERTRFGFSFIHLKYYQDKETTLFNHLNGDHYSVFLYYLSNTAYQENAQTKICNKIFLLNKLLHGIDAFYSISLPDIFMLVHPIGTILGNANYSNYLTIYQNVTIGATNMGIYPIFGEGNILYSKSSVIGECRIGRNVVFGANALVVNKDINNDIIITGSIPNIKENSNEINYYKRFFKIKNRIV